MGALWFGLFHRSRTEMVARLEKVVANTVASPSPSFVYYPEPFSEEEAELRREMEADQRSRQ